jgi:octanoyl-[GcvH]:protein N-octanoyltransferase
MSRRTIRLIREGRPDPPELDTAISRATLNGVAAGRLPETLRLHRPGRLVAFGPRDRVDPGFPAAVAAARERGFGAIERLAGGRAAVFHEGTLAFSWAIPDSSPRDGIRRRFDEVASIMVEALRSLGVDARIGESPGEYCPGEHSVNAGGRTKLIGVGQRVVSGAAHVGGVVVVHDADTIRDVLLPVYEALGLAWEPATVGSVEAELPDVTWDQVEGAILTAFGKRFDMDEGRLEPGTLTLARDLAPRHLVA